MNDAAKSVIRLTAPLGSSQFEITTENCDPVQLLGAAEIIRMLGMEAFAQARGMSLAAEIEARETARGLVVAKRMPPS